MLLKYKHLSKRTSIFIDKLLESTDSQGILASIEIPRSQGEQIRTKQTAMHETANINKTVAYANNLKTSNSLFFFIRGGP
jgi:broad specificity polyphosphatase/5'/3'-nucleotidase SurE